MANENLNTSSTINDLSSEVGENVVQPKDLDDILLERRTRRRMDMYSHNGLLREHVRIYKEMVDGRISLNTAEARSKVVSRIAKQATDRDTILQSEKLVNALEATENVPAQLPYFPDDGATNAGDDSEPTLQ